ncbi:phage tail tape measure protein [Priestia aryabhattai]|uniref:phage tail tape measure protein n=1 Tax=Priestia aryabhattai TaxID=412384 RepID=UPI0015F409DA|nr:phage tail tape measure protein [Priestia aryabhattai]
MSDLKIFLQGNLDFSSTQEAINKQITALEKKVNKLKINIDINDNVIKTMQHFSRAVDDYKKSYDKLNQAVQQNEKVVKNADGTIDRYTTKILKNGEILKSHTQSIDNRNKSIQNESKAIEKNLKVLERQSQLQKRINKESQQGKSKTTETYGDKYMSSTYKKDNSGKVIDKTTTENFAKADRDIERIKNKLTELNRNGTITSQTFNNLSKSLNLASTEAQIKSVQKSMENVIRTQKSLASQKLTQGKVTNFQDNFALDAEKIRRQFRGSIDNGALQSLIQQSKQLSSTTPNLQSQINKLQTGLKQLKLEASTTSSSLQELGRTSLDSFSKFSQWTLTGGAFFGLINAGKQLITVITEVDTKMTELKKVMSPTTNFSEVLVDATTRAKELGKEITSVLDAYGTFARQGFDQNQLKDMADASLIASNVGEMEAGQAAEYLTSAIIQYKMETKDAIGVVDAWNEVSNKNATTVGNLAQGWSRAASISKQFGLDMNELNAAIGTVTASTKVSGNEAGNFLKNVMPRLLGDSGKGALATLGVSLANEAGEMRNAMDIYSEVANKLKSVDSMTKADVLEGLAGKYHISKMSALLDNMDMYNKMLKDSENSAGSARRENETYMESIEAKTNVLKANFQELGLSIGQAFVTEGMIQFIQGMTVLVGGVTKFTNVFGVLPSLFASAGIAALLFNKNLQTAVLTSNLATVSFNKLGIQARATKLILATTGWGIGLLALGFILEKVIGKMGEARQKSEELAAKNRDMVNSYKENKKEIGSLASEYEKLESKINSGSYSTEDLEKFEATRKQLAQLYPTLVQGEDSYGNVILGTSKQIQSQIALAEKQLAVQEKLNAAKAMDEAQDNYKAATKDNKKAQRDKKNAFEPEFSLIPSNPFSMDRAYEVQFANLEKAAKRYKELQDKIAQGDKLSRSEKGQYSYLKDKMNEYTQLSNAAKQSSMNVQSAAMEVINNTVKMDDQTSKSVGSIVSSFTLFASTSDQSTKKVEKTFTGLMNSLQNDANVKPMFNDYAKAIEEYNEQVANGLSGDELDVYKEKVKSTYEEIRNYLIAIAKDNGFSDSAIKELKKNLDSSTIGTLKLSGAQDKANKSTGKTVEEVRNASGAIDEFSGSMDGASSATDDLEKRLKDAQGDFQALAAIAQEQAQVGNMDMAKTIMQGDAYSALSDKVSIYNKILEDNANGKRMSAAEAMELIGKSGDLANAITIENGQVKVNTDAVLKMRDAKIKSYEDGSKAVIQAAINTANATISNLKNYGLEIKAIQKVEDAKKRVADISQTIGETSGMGDMGAREDMDKAYSAAKNVSDLAESIDEMTNMASTGLSQVGTSFADSSKATDGYTGATEDATDATTELTDAADEYTFVLDKYKRQLEEIELLLTKQTSITSKYPTHSKKYRESLKEEIKILEQKAAAITAQNQSLQTQIDEGYIQPTGVVNNGATGLTVGSSGSGSSGSFSGKYANIINEAAAKYGVPPALVAGIIKQESQFNPNARSGAGAKGLMQLMPATSKEMGVSNPYDPRQNIFGGTKYISQMLKKYNGDIETALRAYNAGAGNVANGRAYKFKETNDYVKKVTANYKAYGGSGGKISGSTGGSGGGSTVSNGSASAANYYLKNFRVSTPFGQVDGLHGSGHKGLDLAGKTSGGAMGKPIYSLSDGKVTQVFKNNPSAGNGVIILGSDGRTYRYIHMQKTPPVKVGQKITAGQQIGNIGSTGRSTGAHLDLKVVDTNGKYIDPQKVLNQMAAGGGGGGGSSSSGYNASQEAAQNASNVADAQSQIISNNSALVQIADEIEQKKVDIDINSPLEEFQVKKDNLDSEIEKSQTRNERNLTDSKAYRAELEKQLKLLADKKQVEKEQDAFIGRKMKGNYSDAVKFDLQQKQKELGVQREETLNQIREIQGAILDSSLETYEKTIEKYTDKLSELDAQLARTAQGTSAYAKVLGDKTKATQDAIKANQDEVKFLEQALKSYDLMPDVVENYKDKIKELNTQSAELKDNLKEINKEVIDNELYKYDKKRENDYDTSAKEAELNRTNQGTEAYRKILNDQATIIKSSKANTDAEVAYLEKALKTYELMPDAVEEYTQRLKELKEESLELKDSLQAINKANIDDIMYRFEKQRSGYEFKEGLIGSENQRVEEGTSEWFYKQKKQLDYMRKESESIKLQKEELERRLKYTDLNAQDKADYYEQLNDLAVQYSDSLNDVYNAEKALEDKREEVANTAIDAMKEYYTQQRELSRKAADEQIKDINKVYDAKKRSLSDEISDREYKKNYDELTKQRQQLQSQMNLLLTDTSAEGAVKRNDLKKQIEDLDQQIADLVQNRTDEKRQQNLDDEQQKKLDEIDKQQEAADKAFDELMNNERNWEDLKKQIEEGDYEAVNQEMKRMQNDVLKNFVDLGEAIQTNLIDKLSDVINMMPQIGWSKETSEVNAGATPTINKEDMYYLAGKFLTDEVSGKLSGADASSINEMGSKMSTAARNTGKLNLDKSNTGATYDELALDMTADQKLTLAQYMKLNIMPKLKGKQLETMQKVIDETFKTATAESKSVTASDDFNTAMFKLASMDKQVIDASSGADTSSLSSKLLSALGASSLTSSQTISSSTAIADTFKNFISALTGIKTLTASNSDSKVQDISISVVIDKLLGGENGAKSFLEALQNKIELQGGL